MLFSKMKIYNRKKRGRKVNLLCCTERISVRASPSASSHLTLTLGALGKNRRSARRLRAIRDVRHPRTARQDERRFENVRARTSGYRGNGRLK